MRKYCYPIKQQSSRLLLNANIVPIFSVSLSLYILFQHCSCLSKVVELAPSKWHFQIFSRQPLDFSIPCLSISLYSSQTDSRNVLQKYLPHFKNAALTFNHTYIYDLYLWIKITILNKKLVVFVKVYTIINVLVAQENCVYFHN